MDGYRILSIKNNYYYYYEKREETEYQLIMRTSTYMTKVRDAGR